MARILIATTPLLGHVRPGLPLARALVERGHEVHWYAGRKYRTAIEATGARFLAMKQGRDYDDADMNREFPGLEGLRNMALLRFALPALFIDVIPGHVADLTELQREYEFDLMVNDSMFWAVPAFFEQTGVPFVSFGVSVLAVPSRDTAPFGPGLSPSSSPLGRVRNRFLTAMVDLMLMREVDAHYQNVRASIGLPPTVNGSFFGAPLLCESYLQTSTPGFEYPRSDMPPQVEFVGPFLPPRSTQFIPPTWWDELRQGRPVVHVSQGTLETDARRLLLPTLRALADEDVLVIATTGGPPVESLGVLPANARAATFLDYAHLLPHVDVMITNGGYGGVSIALAHGLPLIVAGDTEEKPEVAQRVAWSGAGINLRTGEPSEAKLRAAVRRVLADRSYRDNAARLQAEIGSYDALNLATDAIERVLGRALARAA